MSGKSSPGLLGRYEFVPFADHVAVFVHDGVPDGDGAHAVPVGAAVADFAGFGDGVASRAHDLVFGFGALRSMRTFASIIGASVVDVVRIGAVLQEEAELGPGARRRLERAAARLGDGVGKPLAQRAA